MRLEYSGSVDCTTLLPVRWLWVQHRSAAHRSASHHLHAELPAHCFCRAARSWKWPTCHVACMRDALHFILISQCWLWCAVTAALCCCVLALATLPLCQVALQCHGHDAPCTSLPNTHARILTPHAHICSVFAMQGMQTCIGGFDLLTGVRSGRVDVRAPAVGMAFSRDGSLLVVATQVCTATNTVLARNAVLACAHTGA